MSDKRSRLAKPKKPAPLALEPPALEETPVSVLDNGQCYASFTIELLLDQTNEVRRTQIINNRSKDEEQWAGWDESRLLEALKKGAALQFPIVEPAQSTATFEFEAEVVPTEPTVSAATGEKPIASGPAGTLQLRALEPLPADSARSHRVLGHDVPLKVRLDLDLTEVIRSDAEPLRCTATVYAKRLGSHERQVIGEESSNLGLGNQPALFIACQPLPAGTYRLDALVTATSSTTAVGLRAYLEGGFLQVN